MCDIFMCIYVLHYFSIKQVLYGLVAVCVVIKALAWEGGGGGVL